MTITMILPPFISTDDLAALIGAPVDGADLITDMALDAACTSVRSYLQQEVNYHADATEELDGRGLVTLRLRERPIRSVASVTVDGVALETTDWNLRGNLLRRIDCGVFTLGIANVVVVYSHGWDISDPVTLPVPADIRLVALIAARRVYSAVGASDSGGTQQSETMGSYSYTSASTAQVASTAAQLLGPEMAVLDRYRVGLIP